MPDPTTQSNYLRVHTTNVDLNWSLDFESQIVEGTATHTVLAQEADVEEVMYMNYSRFPDYWILLTLPSRKFRYVGSRNHNGAGG
jgi:hypothetical protein